MTQFAEIDGARIAYDVGGAGPALVLIHAGVTTRGMWDDVIPLLEGDHTVIRFDMRGFGETLESDQLEWRADRDVLAVMNAAGAERASLVGVSMGGGAALDTALTNPERVDAVVAVNPGVAGFQSEHGDWETKKWKQMYALWDEGRKDEVARLEMEIWLAGPSVAEGYWNKPAETGEAFHATIAGNPDRRYLRSGDLGFVRGGQQVEEVSVLLLICRSLIHLRGKVFCLRGYQDLCHPRL